MAQRTAEGKNLVLLIDTLNTGASYDLVVCLTSNSFARTANVIDASSKCGTEKLNGVILCILRETRNVCRSASNIQGIVLGCRTWWE